MENSTQADRPRLSIPIAALVGIVSVGAGVAVAHLLAAITGPEASPLVGVGSAFIDLTPTWLKEFAVAKFGTADKPILLGSIGIVLLAISALAGVLARRARIAGCIAVALVGVIAAVAALSRPESSPIDALPSLAGSVIAALTMAFLTRAPAPAVDGTGPARRTVLLGSLAVAGGALAVGVVGNVLGGSLRNVDAARAAVKLPTPAEPVPPLPAVDVKVDGVSPFRISNSDFYRVDTALVVPAVNPDDWTLSVGGMVDRPYSLNYAELLAMPMIERDLTLTCVSNEVGGQYVGNAVWLGVRLKDVLAKAGVSRSADQLFSRSVDGWTASTPMAAALDERDAIIAVAMNGEPLPAEHGFPARMVIPGLYGFVSATKWLTSLEATTYSAQQAYWTQRGWATDAPIRTMTRVEVPKPLSTVKAGAIAIAGTAWAQHRGIERVEVQVDDEPWGQARLGAVPSVDTWRQWWIPWNAKPGRHTIRARATDATGKTQPDARLTPFPSGAQGWHEVVVNVS